MHTVSPALCTFGLLSLAWNVVLVVGLVALLVWHQAKVKAIIVILKMLLLQKPSQANSPHSMQPRHSITEQEQSDDDDEGLPPSDIFEHEKKRL